MHFLQTRRKYLENSKYELTQHKPMSKDNSLTSKEIFLKAASYCAYQERCESEVRKKLLDLGARGYDIEELIELLKEENFLDEIRYAETFVRGKFRLKKWGRMKISQALMQKGVEDNFIHDALAGIDEQEYLDTLYRLLQKKWISVKDEDTFKKKGKVFNYGVSKGFEPNYIWQVIRELELE